MNRLFATGLLALASLSAAASSPVATYPDNPSRDGDEIYVSQQGVYRFDLPGTVPRWSSLLGVETYAPVVLERQLLVGSTQGLYALDRASGRVIWRLEPTRTIFSPSVAGQAYAGSVHGDLYAIDPADGRIAWRHRFAGWIYSPALDPESGLAWSGGQMHEVHALDLADGAPRARLTTTQESVFSPLDLGDGRAAFNLFDGTTLVIDMRSGRTLANLDGQSQPTGLRRVGERLLRSHRDGMLAIFSTQDLALLAQRRVTGRDPSLHPARDSWLLLSDLDQRLFLLEAADFDRVCEARADGRWSLPLQLSGLEILYFRRKLQPPRLSLVQTRAQCNK